MKWIARSKSGASKSRPRWAAHTRIGNVWEYPPRPRGLGSVQPKFIVPLGTWNFRNFKPEFLLNGKRPATIN